MFGHRSIYHDGWRAVCPWPGRSFTEAATKGRQFGSPIPNEVLLDIETHDWELYHVDEDYSETHDLAAEHRDKLIEMIGRWWAEAGKYQVLPIDGDVRSRLNVERPTIARPRNKIVYYPGGSSVPFAAAPKIYNRPWSITADVVIPEGGAEGVLLAQGGRTGGYSFFVKDQKLYFLYNWLGRDKFWLKSDEMVPEGEVELRYEFEPTGKPDIANGLGVPARGQLYINRKLVGQHRHAPLDPDHVRDGGPDLRLRRRRSGGCRRSTATSSASPGPSSVSRLDLSGELIPDTEADMKIAMARQ